MSQDPPPPVLGSQRSAFWWGVVVGILPGVITVMTLNSSSPLSGAAFFGALLIWPVVAVIAAFSRSTRAFGKGMLAGVGAGWLTMLAICGGKIMGPH